MGSHLLSVLSPRPRWEKPLAAGVAAGVPLLLFDWELLGFRNSALRFVGINDGASPLIFTPEAAYHEAGPAETGSTSVAPQPFTVPAGECFGDPYGIDEMRPYWRFWVDGSGAFRWGVLGIGFR